MELKQQLIEALQDETVISAFMAACGLHKTKPTSSKNNKNIEEDLINNHVIFAAKETEDAKLMLASEIFNEIVELTGTDIDFRPRIFAGILNRNCEYKKRIDTGTAYNVHKIVEDVNEYTAEIEVESEEITNEPSKEKEQTSVNGNVVQEYGEEDKELILKATDDFDKITDYQDWLKGISRKGLIKHVNKFKMKILGIEDLSENELRESIWLYVSTGFQIIVDETYEKVHGTKEVSDDEKSNENNDEMEQIINYLVDNKIIKKKKIKKYNDDDLIDLYKEHQSMVNKKKKKKLKKVKK